MYGWLVFGALALAYAAAFVALRRRERSGSSSPYVGDVAARTPAAPLDETSFRAAHALGGGEETPSGFATMGPLIVWRTQFGKRWIAQVARPKRLWNVVADIGVWITWFLGIAVFLLLILGLAQYVTRPEESVQNAPGPRELLGIPGINPMIPLGYGIAALLLALVIHEGSHGVMAYVAKIRVKSLGLVALVIPIGAFVEPHEEDILRATTRQKNRLFAAGPTSNIVLAGVAGVLLSTLFLSHIGLAGGGGGVLIGSVSEGSPAQQLGLEVGDVILSIGDRAVTTPAEFTERMATTKAGQALNITYARGDETHTAVVTLADKYQAYRATNPELEDRPPSEGGYTRADTEGDGFLGVGTMDLRILAVIAQALNNPFASLPAFFLYLSYPLVVFRSGIDVLSAPYNELFVISGPLAALPPAVFFGLATFLYWLVWLNLMLGTFNALPAGPLDGGQMFRATLSERLMRRYRVDRERIEIERRELGQLHVKGKDEETQRKLDRVNLNVSRATRALGFFILGLILLPLFAPPLLRLFL